MITIYVYDIYVLINTVNQGEVILKMVLGNPDSLSGISDNVTDVHVTFRPSERWIFQLVAACPDLKLIQVPACHMKTISSSIKEFLRMKGIILVKGTVHRSDKFIA